MSIISRHYLVVGLRLFGYVYVLKYDDRHAMLVNQNTEGVLVPLNANLQSEGRLELANSTYTQATLSSHH